MAASTPPENRGTLNFQFEEGVLSQPEDRLSNSHHIPDTPAAKSHEWPIWALGQDHVSTNALRSAPKRRT